MPRAKAQAGVLQWAIATVYRGECLERDTVMAGKAPQICFFADDAPLHQNLIGSDADLVAA